MAMAPIPTPEGPVAQAARARARRPPRDGTRPPRPAVALVASGVGRGGSRRPDATTRRCPMARSELDRLASQLDSECEWFVANEVLPADVVTHNRRLAELRSRPWTPVFMHGDLQVCHIFVDGDEVTGILDWSEGGQGDALWDLAVLTMGHPEHPRRRRRRLRHRRRPRRGPRRWWSLRCLLATGGWSSTATVGRGVSRGRLAAIPAVGQHAPDGYEVPFCHLGHRHRRPGPQHGPAPLLCHGQLHQHSAECHLDPRPIVPDPSSAS